MTSPESQQGEVLPDKARRLFRAPVLAVLCTVSPSGRPQCSPVWVANDGHTLRFSIGLHRLKIRYLERNPSVSVWCGLECGRVANGVLCAGHSTPAPRPPREPH